MMTMSLAVNHWATLPSVDDRQSWTKSHCTMQAPSRTSSLSRKERRPFSTW